MKKFITKCILFACFIIIGSLLIFNACSTSVSASNCQIIYSSVFSAQNIPQDKKVKKGYVLTAQDLPVIQYEGYTFDGWDKNVGDIITQDTYIHAGWTIIQNGSQDDPDSSNQNNSQNKNTSEETVDDGPEQIDPIKEDQIIETTPVLAEVIGLRATAGNSCVILGWGINEDATNYYGVLVKYIAKDGSEQTNGIFTSKSHEALINYLDNGFTYTFRIYTCSKPEGDIINVSENYSTVTVTCGVGYTKEGNFVIGGNTIPKTRMQYARNSSYTVHGNGSEGCFIDDRTVNIPKISVGCYPVTQEFFNVIMGKNPSAFTIENEVDVDTYIKKVVEIDSSTGTLTYNDVETHESLTKLRPVENVSWFDAIVFCNELSILMSLEPCYSMMVYGESTTDTREWGAIPENQESENWDAFKTGISCDFSKNGFRLPTEAEWEFVARGAYPDNLENVWNTEYSPNSEAVRYKENSKEHTWEVGILQSNNLGYYDLSGNVYEWTWDNYAGIDASTVYEGPAVADPLNYPHTVRGGSWNEPLDKCKVTFRNSVACYTRSNEVGFRIVQTVE